MNPAEKTSEEHVHSFAVDCSCECGIMLSAYVRGLKAQQDALAHELLGYLPRWEGAGITLQPTPDDPVYYGKLNYWENGVPCASYVGRREWEQRERAFAALRRAGRLPGGGARPQEPPPQCGLLVPNHGQSRCTRDRNHPGGHECRLADVERRREGLGEAPRASDPLARTQAAGLRAVEEAAEPPSETPGAPYWPNNRTSPGDVDDLQEHRDFAQDDAGEGERL